LLFPNTWSQSILKATLVCLLRFLIVSNVYLLGLSGTFQHLMFAIAQRLVPQPDVCSCAKICLQIHWYFWQSSFV
jgi:hypothetical protein